MKYVCAYQTPSLVSLSPSLGIDKVENLVAMALNSTAIMVSWEVR